ncbi:putative reverse transcriptase domain-containing protein [Tanacetum coccineum]
MLHYSSRLQHECSIQKADFLRILKSSDSVLGALKFSYICFRSVFCVFFVASLPPNLACIASNKAFSSVVTGPGIVEVEVSFALAVVRATDQGFRTPALIPLVDPNLLRSVISLSYGAKEFFYTEGVVGLLTWFESMKSMLHISLFPAESQVELASSAIAQPWEDFKKLLMKEYYPDDEIQKLELEFWNHKMVGSDIDGYTTRFHELARLVPYMVSLKSQCVNRYIRGLAPKIKANVTSYKTSTIYGAARMANHLTTDRIKDGIFKKKENTGDKKRLNDQHNN